MAINDSLEAKHWVALGRSYALGGAKILGSVQAKQVCSEAKQSMKTILEV